MKKVRGGRFFFSRQIRGCFVKCLLFVYGGRSGNVKRRGVTFPSSLTFQSSYHHLSVPRSRRSVLSPSSSAHKRKKQGGTNHQAGDRTRSSPCVTSRMISISSCSVSSKPCLSTFVSFVFLPHLQRPPSSLLLVQDLERLDVLLVVHVHDLLVGLASLLLRAVLGVDANRVADEDLYWELVGERGEEATVKDGCGGGKRERERGREREQ